MGTSPLTNSVPNFLIIVADDLGFSDLGAFGSEIDTPHLDALALNGIRLTGFHTAPACSPTRSMLLSGIDNHKVGLGSMAELRSPNQHGQPGYEGYLRPDVASLAERLREQGFTTLFSGKWHLGLEERHDPYARGFSQSFAMLQGAHNHYGIDAAPSRNPLQQGSRKARTYTENGRVLASLPTGFYSSDGFTDKLIAMLENTQHDAAPFFAYLAYTAPHWPLQAPAADIAKYRGRYAHGFEQLRNQRIARQRELGLLPDNVAIHDFHGRRWSELSAEQQALEARNMEVYAAMIDRMDQNVGRLMDSLKQQGRFDNTVILFLSDNGAEGADLSTISAFDETIAEADNRLESIGGPASFTGIGPGWAQAASAPSWLYKGYATEGGTRTVSFIGGAAFKHHGVFTHYAHVKDVVPTLLALSGIPITSVVAGHQVQQVEGNSWFALLDSLQTPIYANTQAIGTELHGSRSIRRGDWKLLKRISAEEWLLFNIAEDPGETTDLSTRYPAIRQQLLEAWETYAKDTGVIIGDRPTWLAR